MSRKNILVENVCILRDFRLKSNFFQEDTGEPPAFPGVFGACLMNFFLTDLLYAWRAARRSPGVTLAIIAMLALGTGGVAAVFYPAYSQVYAPLPFPQPEQLVISGGDIFSDLLDWQTSRFERRDELDRFLSNVAAYATRLDASIYMPDTGKYKYSVNTVIVTEEFFETLGVRPVRGSVFSRGKDQEGVVISYRLWRDEFGRSDDAVGKLIQSIRYNTPMPIIGIMPESFDFPAGADIWFNSDGDPWHGYSPDSTDKLIGRLQPWMSTGWLIREIRNLLAGGSPVPRLQSLRSALYGDRTSLLLMLGAAAVLFLLLVCAGVMNLLVAQGARRKSEMALRLTLGAARRNLVFKLLRETLPLVVIGALAGLWISETLSALIMAQFPSLNGGEVAVPVKIAFFAALIFAVTIMGGLTPAFYISGVDLNTYLKSGTDFKRRYFSLREILTGAQLALALALLINMGLLLRSTMFNINVPVELSSGGVAVVMASFPEGLSQYAEANFRRRAMIFQEFTQRMEAMPEVAAVGSFYPVPFSREAAVAITGQSLIVSKTYPEGRQRETGVEGIVSPKGFGILGIPFMTGRPFTEADAANEREIQIRDAESRTNGEDLMARIEKLRGMSGAAIINQSLAQRLWPGENAVGKIIYVGGFGFPREVVGVLRDFYQTGDNKKILPAVYRPDPGTFDESRFLVKLHSDALMRDFRQRLSAPDMNLSYIEVRRLSDYISESTADMRLTLQLVGGFALLGIVVAGLGVYATTSLMAAAMSREMGIRAAMGAQTRDILLLAFWRGARAIILGLPLGLFLAWVLSRILSSLLFQVNTNDPPAWLISCAALLGITAIAALIPALRAARANPADAMKNE